MKKIITIAAIAMLSFAARSAMVNWSIDEAWNSSGDLLGGSYSAFFMDSATYSLSEAQSAIAAQDVSFLANALSGDEGKFAAFDDGYAYNSNVGNFPNSSTVNGYIVILDNSDYTKATLAYISEEASTTISGTGLSQDIEFGSLEGTKTASNWQAVPEPTSGLLLLLGMAGLALKRKRA